MNSRTGLLIVAAATLVAFGDVHRNDFVNWDDRQNIVENGHLDRFDGETVSWAFSTFQGGHYQPLSWLTLAADVAVWGRRPAGIHLTNLIIHVANAVLFWLVCRAILSCAWPGRSRGITAAATIGALLFAVHPLRVESVAWATERRDVLSGFWLLLCVLLYVRANRPYRADDADEGSRRAMRMGAWLAFVLSLLSKASGMTFPVVLLLLDWWPLGRLSSLPAAAGNRHTTGRLRVLIGKGAYLVPAIGFAILAARAQHAAGAMWSFAEHPLGLRIGQAFYGVMFYPLKTLAPFALSPLYEQRPDASALDLRYLAGLVGGIVVTVAVWRYRRISRGPLVAWLVYLSLVAPVLGLAQSGPQVVADRYSYLSCMSLVLLLAAGAVRFIRGSRQLLAATAVVVLLLVAATRAQVAVWRDSRTLWTHVIATGTSRGIAHANLAAVLNEEGAFAEACDHARTALETLPGNLGARIALGTCLAGLNEPEQAIEQYEAARDITARLGRSTAYLDFRIGVVYASSHAWERAAAHLRQAVEEDPGLLEARFVLSGVRARTGQLDLAERALRDLLAVDPGHERAVIRLAGILERRGAYGSAVAELRRFLAVHSGGSAARFRLAWLLSTAPDDAVRNGGVAVELAQAIVGAPGAGWREYELLGAALAEAGRFDEAVAAVNRALGSDGLDAAARARLEDQAGRYRAGRPYRVNTEAVREDSIPADELGPADKSSDRP